MYHLLWPFNEKIEYELLKTAILQIVQNNVNHRKGNNVHLFNIKNNKLFDVNRFKLRPCAH